jgi:DNA-directed RNA polymerase subunit RPC12/RpoP
MNEGQKHEMVLEATHPSGEEEWNCPTCGRRLLINWEPMFKKTVLETGDEFSIHSGGKGGLSMGSVEVGEPKEPVLPAKIVAALEKIVKDFDLDDPSNVFDSNT